MMFMEEVRELDIGVGQFLMSSFDAAPSVGSVDHFGWAGWFDVDDVPGIPGAVVIVGVFPDNSMKVESFDSAAWASWRWLMWDEMFCAVVEAPKQHDMIVILGDDGRFMEAKTNLIFSDWGALDRFVNKIGLKYRKRKLWFLDRPSGNYYRLDL